MAKVSAGWAELIKEVRGFLDKLVNASQTSQSIAHHTSSVVAKQGSETVVKKKASLVGSDQTNSLTLEATLRTSLTVKVDVAEQTDFVTSESTLKITSIVPQRNFPTSNLPTIKETY